MPRQEAVDVWEPFKAEDPEETEGGVTRVTRRGSNNTTGEEEGRTVFLGVFLGVTCLVRHAGSSCKLWLFLSVGFSSADVANVQVGWFLWMVHYKSGFRKGSWKRLVCHTGHKSQNHIKPFKHMAVGHDAGTPSGHHWVMSE